MAEIKTLFLFLITTIAEIVGCYLPCLVIKNDKSILLLIPAAASLTLFAWLLSLHPTASGRVCAAYANASKGIKSGLLAGLTPGILIWGWALSGLWLAGYINSTIFFYTLPWGLVQLSLAGILAALIYEMCSKPRYSTHFTGN